MPVTVLHVDDDQAFLDVLERSVAALDASIDLTTATSATEATDLLDERSFDCVVSDYVTAPDGEAFLRTVGERFPELPLVFVSGKSLDALPDRAIRSMLADHLEKRSSGLFEALVDSVHRQVSGAADSTAQRAFLEEATPERTLVRTIDVDDHPVYDVLDVLAGARGTDVGDLPPLYECVDVDALETILSADHSVTDSTVEVRFAYDSFDVLVSTDGALFVHDTRAAGDP